MTTALYLSSFARSIWSSTYEAVTGLMSLSRWTASTRGVAAPAACAKTRAANSASEVENPRKTAGITTPHNLPSQGLPTSRRTRRGPTVGVMKAFLIAAAFLLAAPAAAHAADASIWSREVPLSATRAPAGASVRPFDLVGVHWRGSGTVELRTRTSSGNWSPWRAAAPEAEDRPDRGSRERSPSGWKTGSPWWAPGSTRLEVRTR